MKIRLTLLISFLLLTSCATSTTPSSTPDVRATLIAAESVHQQAANAATAQAAEATRRSAQATQQSAFATETAVSIATGTAQIISQAQTATSETLAIRASEQALSNQATMASIAADATGTAVARLAIAEQHLVEDEARRLALQREAEATQIAYQQRINRFKPYLWGGLVIAIIILAGGATFVLYQRSQPRTVTDISGPRVLIPANGWQVLPSRTSAPLALPAPKSNSQTESTSNPMQLPPLAQGHVLIAGETGSGKSTAMLAVLKRRSQVVVLDPHASPNLWGQAQVIGGGRDFEAISQFMGQMRHLLSTRYTQRARGITQFDSLTVATDEMPAIVAALGRQVDEVWREWLREGRKVGLFFVASTQSTRVKTLGIRGEGDLLENFTYVLLLGKLAVNKYPQLVEGMERPAILRTIQGIRSIVVPFEPQNKDSNSQSNSIFIAPSPTTEQNDFADPNALTETTRLQIQRLAKELPSQAAIERAVFGYTGGAAYRAVKQVLNNPLNTQKDTATTSLDTHIRLFGSSDSSTTTVE